MGDILQPGDKVGVTTNLTGGTWYTIDYQNQTGLPSGKTYWTHPIILCPVDELVKDVGAAEIYIMEAIYDCEFFNNYGYREVADDLGAILVDLNQKDPYNNYAERPVGNNAFIYEKLIQN